MTPRPWEHLGERIWVVFGGGGLKGLTHLGAWKAIRRAGIEPAGIVGTSIGSFMACTLASGMTTDRLERLARNLEPGDIVRVNRRVAWIKGIRQPSVLQGEVLRSFYSRILAQTTWEDMQMGAQVNAVSLTTGESVWFGPGARTDVSVVDAVLASSSLPVLLPPVQLLDDYFVDGGVVDMLGLDRAADCGATGIIAIDAGGRGPQDADEVVARGLVGIQQRLFGIMSTQRRLEKLHEWSRLPLLVVRPELDGFGLFDFDHLAYFLDEGYRAAASVLEDPTS